MSFQKKGWKKAADQGNLAAQYNLGVIYQLGHGVPIDSKEAEKLYRTAANQGHERAQYNLGNMYNNGWGVPKDRSEAIKWYKRAADQGDNLAKEALQKLGVAASK